MSLEETAQLYATVLRQLLPVGGYDTAPNTVVAADVYAHAKVLAQVDLDAKRLLSVLEGIPTELLSEYEYEYGLPLKCTVNATKSIEERLQILNWFKNTEDVVNRAYLEQLLSIFGVQLIELVTYKPMQCTTPCNVPVNTEQLRYKVMLKLQSPVLADMSCLIEHYLPAYLRYDLSIEQTQVIQNFDFAVLRYVWTSNAGSDLDTRTGINAPAIDAVVGWNRKNNLYLTWGAEPTNTNAEAVLLDLQKLKTDFNNAEQFKIDCRAFWFGQPKIGKITLQFESYIGGTMQLVNNDFINIDGQKVQNLSLSVSTQLHSKTDIEGELLAYLTFNRTTNKGQFSPVSQTTSITKVNDLTGKLEMSQVVLNWTNPTLLIDDGATQIVERSTDGTSFTTVDTSINSSDTTFKAIDTDIFFEVDTVISYRITTTTSYGTKLVGNVVNITVPAADISAVSDLTVNFEA